MFHNLLQVGLQLCDLRLGPEMHHEPGVDHHNEGPPAVQRSQPTVLQRACAGRHVPLRSTRYDRPPPSISAAAC